MSELVRRSQEILASLDVPALKAAGIWPAPDYELIFNYPPFQTLEPVGQETVFPDNSPDESPRTIAFYLHFPYCQSICGYCHYARSICPQNSLDVWAEWVIKIQHEAELYAKILKNVEVQSIHLGGGTPSLLSPSMLARALGIIDVEFKIQRDIERTVEANPASMSSLWLRKARHLGFTRLNIGIQSLDDELLRICKRPHNRQQAIRAIGLACQEGFVNLNVDLIFGLPTQTLDRWEETLRTIIDLDPASVTTYKLRNKQGAQFGGRPQTDFPTVEDQLVMHIMAIEALADAGYQPWHFETLFVKESKFSHRHQEWKWQESGELLGLGVSAYSHMNQCVYHNTQDPKEYHDLLAQNRLPIAVGRRLTNVELMHRWIVLGLMMLTVGQEPFRQKFGIKPSKVFTEPLRRLEDLGLLEITDEAIRVTRYPGLLFPMEIMTQFYTAEDQAKLRAKGLHYGSFPAR